MKMSLLLVTIAAVSMATAVPLVRESSVKVTQRADRTVEISYTLENEPAVIIVDLQTNSLDGAWVSMGDAALSLLSGSNHCLVAEAGVHKLEWKARKLALDVDPLTFRAKITAYSINCPPDYMVVDLLPGGDVPRYYASSNDVPGGVLAECYRTDKMLMRRIPAANVEFRMGEYLKAFGTGGYEKRTVPHMAVLSHDYYIGVFEFTDCQRQVARSSNKFDKPYPQSWLLPLNDAYSNVRGASSEAWQGWPLCGHEVAEQSFLYALRMRTGLEFDMPTSAEWEFACRAGSVTSLNNHRNLKKNGNEECPNAVEVGWYTFNTLNDSPREKPGGLKRPNDFGLYDMHGNKAEFVLDAYTYYSDPSIVVDPKGVAPETFPPKRTLRGGSAYNTAELMMSGMTFDQAETAYAGHRFVCPAVAK